MLKFSKGYLLIVVIMVFTPIKVSAQMLPSKDVQYACTQAKIDAQYDVNSCLWFGLGCLLPFPLGWPLLPVLIVPKPPATRFIGMPPDYIAQYKQCYKEATKKVQLSKSMIGCIVGCLLL